MPTLLFPFLLIIGAISQEINPDTHVKEPLNQTVQISEAHDSEPVIYLPVEGGTYEPVPMHRLALEIAMEERTQEYMVFHTARRRANSHNSGVKRTLSHGTSHNSPNRHVASRSASAHHNLPNRHVASHSKSKHTSHSAQSRHAPTHVAAPAHHAPTHVVHHAPSNVKTGAKRPATVKSPKKSKSTKRASTRRATTKCKNIGKNCPSLIGHCDEEKLIPVMHRYCTEQCGFCVPENCRDISPNCATMKQQGFCESQNNYFTEEHRRMFCAKTCLLCAEHVYGSDSDNNNKNDDTPQLHGSIDGRRGPMESDGDTENKRPKGSHSPSNNHKPSANGHKKPGSKSNGHHKPNSAENNHHPGDGHPSSAHKPSNGVQPDTDNNNHKPGSGAHKPSGDNNNQGNNPSQPDKKNPPSGGAKKPDSKKPDNKKPDSPDSSKNPPSNPKNPSSNPKNPSNSPKNPSSNPKNPTDSNPPDSKQPGDKQPDPKDDKNPDKNDPKSPWYKKPWDWAKGK